MTKALAGPADSLFNLYKPGGWVLNDIELHDKGLSQNFFITNPPLSPPPEEIEAFSRQPFMYD